MSGVLGTLHHLGVACRDLDAEECAWLALGWMREGEDFEDTIQAVKGRFLIGPGPKLELLSPLRPGSPIDALLAKGVKIYHQAFEVPSLESALAFVQAAGGRLQAPMVPASAFEGRRIAFVLLPNLNLLELIEASKP